MRNSLRSEQLVQAGTVSARPEKKPLVKGEHEGLGGGESQGATIGLRAGSMRPAALRSRRSGRMVSESLKGGQELSSSRPPRLVLNTTVRSRRISRRENDIWLRMVLHQDPLPYLGGRKSDEDGRPTVGQRINSPLRRGSAENCKSLYPPQESGIPPQASEPNPRLEAALD